MTRIDTKELRTSQKLDRMNRIVRIVAEEGGGMMKRVSVIASLILALSCANAGAQFSDPFTVSASLTQSATNGLVLSVAFTVPPKHYLYADQLSVQAEGNVQLRPIGIPEAKKKYDKTFGKTLRVFDQDSTFLYGVEGGAELPLRVTIGYQGCIETLCFLPQTKNLVLNLGVPGAVDAVTQAPPRAATSEVVSVQERLDRFTLVGRAAGYMKPSEFTAVLDRAESGKGLGQESLFDSFVGKGAILLAVGVVLVGLGLNLTPCVLPMIPINIAIIGAGIQGSSTGSSRARGFALGLTYGAGIAFVYGLLGLLVVLTGSRFGELNSSPAFNFGVAAVFLLLSLGMFGVFNLDFTRFQKAGGTDVSRGGRFGAAFIMGAIAALLAGACVAPAVISVLLQSAVLYGQGRRIGLLLPFLLGVGMALPWPFAGAGLSFLPKAGAWMERVKRVFGVMILAAALYYGYTGYSLITGRGVVTGRDAEGWLYSLDEGLEIAEREGKPVFVDIWASWCKACKKMDATTFKDAIVMERLEHYVKVKFVADKQKDPAVKAVLDRFVRVGLPTYVILAPVVRTTDHGAAEAAGPRTTD